MEHHLYYLIMTYLFILFFGSAHLSQCKNLLARLADKQARFVDCMSKHSVPAQSCLTCIFQYDDMVHDYDNIVSDLNCSIEIINSNRLNIVYDTQKFLVDVWSKGFCDDCFNGTVTSEETQTFINMTKDFEDCLKTHQTNNSCKECSAKYADLNSLYKNMEEAKKGKICFDNQDMMNRTRSHWSKDLQCCRREYSLTLFFITSSLFTALPILFYFGMFSYTKYVERNHEVLDADLNNEHASTSSSSRLHSTVISNAEERPPHASDSSFNFEDVSKLKKQRDLLKDKSTANTNANDTLKLESPTGPHSSNQVRDLIEI